MSDSITCPKYGAVRLRRMRRSSRCGGGAIMRHDKAPGPKPWGLRCGLLRRSTLTRHSMTVGVEGSPIARLGSLQRGRSATFRNSLARCVVALYCPPTQIWWGRVLAEGSRPHRGRCPSRLLPRRALPRRGQWLRVIASRQSTPVLRDRTGAGAHSSGGIVTYAHRSPKRSRGGPWTPASRQSCHP